jgi:hypothetical protein
MNLMKTPMNPMFDSDTKYEEFRATVKIWLPSLQTLDGTDFSANSATIVIIFIFHLTSILES